MAKQSTFLLFTTETYPAYAGDGLNALLFARTLVRKGYNTSIVCLNPNGSLPNADLIDGVRIIRIPYKIKTKVGRAFLRIKMILSLFRIGMHYSHWLIYGAMPAHRLIILFGRLFNSDVLFRSTLYGFDNANKLISSENRLANFFNRKIYKKVSAYYALNSVFKSEWEASFKNHNCIFLSPQGVDVDRYEKVDASKSELRDRLNLPVNRPIVLMVGHLINRKGFPEIFEWLCGIEEDFLLVHVGRSSAPSWDAISTRNAEMISTKSVGEKMLGNRILFAGETLNPETYFLSADIFLLASYSEGFPSNSINEAMAAGLPILSRKIVGSMDYIVDGSTGILFESETEFIEKFRILLLNQKQRQALGVNAKNFVLKNNKVDDVVSNFLKFLNV
ncbi:glycosyl transferase [Tenuifilaceae bacterium CYCD]|nr:glycosyl transferase [Tenuifilaceae bacterium CYCD]